MAVRLNLHSDVLEESAVRSTTDGTLSSAIAGLESRIAPHREKLAAGRMLPAAAFAGGDGDLSKLKALKEVACMIQKLGSMTFHDACIMLVHVRHRFYAGLNAALDPSCQLQSPQWRDKEAGHEMLARLPPIRVPLETFGPNGGRKQSLLLPIIPGVSDAELLEHIALVKELREAREAARRRGDAFDAAKFKLLIGAQPPSARAAIEYIVVKTAGDEVRARTRAPGGRRGCAALRRGVLGGRAASDSFAEFGIFYKSPTVEAPADAAEPRLEPAPEGVDEAELNVQAAAAADPAAAELPAGPRVTATAPAAAPPTATNALAAFAVLL